MSTKRYLKGFISFSAGTWVSALISFFATPVISYLIVPEEFGRASIYTLIYNIALIVSIMGLDQSFVRHYYEIDENDRMKLFWECLIPSFVIWFFLSLVFVIFEKKFSAILFGQYYPFISILFSLTLFTGIFQRFNQLSVRMQQKGFAFSTIRIVYSVSNVLFTIFFAKFISPNFYAIVTGQIFGNIVALIYGFIYDKSSRKFGKVDFSNLKKYLKYGIPFVPTFLITWLFTSIDRISLRQYSNFNELGLYTAAFKIISVMNLVQAGFTTFWVPVSFEKYEKEPENKDFFRKAFLSVSFVMYIFGLLVLGFKDIIFLLLSPSYRDASYIAPFLVLSPIMYTISETTVVGINFKKKTYWHMIVATVSALINFIGNTLLVPVLSGKGAAISTGLSYIVFFSMRTKISKKLYEVKYDLSKVIFSNVIIIVVALIGTFRKNILETVVSALGGILIVLFLYRHEVSRFINEFRKGLESKKDR